MRHPPFAVVAVGALGALALFPLLAGGCGGGGGGGGNVTIPLGSVAAVDGIVDGSGAVITTGGLVLGDGALNLAIHGYYRFNLSAIPAGATILSATLITYQTSAGMTGVPFTDLGPLLVDHMDLGAGLGPEDFNGTTFTFAVATLSTNLIEETKTADVTAEVQADRAAARTTSDFRLRFTLETDTDGLSDTVNYASAENDFGSGVFPTLSVTYHP